MITKTIPISKEAVLDLYIQDPAVSFQTYTKRPALIICPGGAYLIHATKEGEPVALNFLARGFHTFVLKYTVATDRLHPEKGVNVKLRYPTPSIELMEAIHLICEHADEWFVDSDAIFLAGFSAGAHVAGTVGYRWNDPELVSQLSFTPQGNELKPAGLVLGYPMVADNPGNFSCSAASSNIELVNQVLYGTQNPSLEQIESVKLKNYVQPQSAVPTFIWHSVDDSVVSPDLSLELAQTLMHHQINCEYHLFSHGGHGLGLANEDPALRVWPYLAEIWMKSLEKNNEYDS